MIEITVEAVTENLDKVTDFVNNALEERGCSMRDILKIDVAVDAIIANTARYAYDHGKGDMTLRLSFEEDPLRVEFEFIDSGKPFDPLEREDPDVSLDAAHRKIGGLGIFVVKKTMDKVSYRYADGQNILTVVKNLAVV